MAPGPGAADITTPTSWSGRHTGDAYNREILESGQIVLMEGKYRQFLATEPVFSGRNADLVTANFAPLNLIEDLSELFLKCAAACRGSGCMQRIC